MAGLWGDDESCEDDMEYPYPRDTDPIVNTDPGFPRRVDSQLSNEHRVGVMLGLLEAPKRCS